MGWLLEPWQFAFMRQALLACLLVGSTCSLLGVHVVLRRMAFLGDAIAHTTLPGLVIAYLNRWNLLLGALVAALLTALGIGWISRSRQLREDTAIGVVFSGMFSLGIVLMSFSRSSRDLSHLLFGNVLGVTVSDLWGIGLVCLLVYTLLALFHKELVLTSVDPLHARTIGLAAERLRYLLLVLLALAIVTGIQAVGVILTTALMVTPAATALLLTQDLKRMFVSSMFCSLFSSLVGLYVSYYASVASGAAIVLTSTLLFILAWCISQCGKLAQR